METEMDLRSLAPRRIAVFRALFLGDLLCSIPALNALDRRFPDAEITLVGLPWAKELAERLPAVDHFAEFPGYPGIPEVPCGPGRMTDFLAEARRVGYDLAIQLHGSGEISNGFVADLGASTSLGFGPADDKRLSL
ncbi:MAG: glycosyltransferase family 9 protein, partial [Solirubrobacteraceae bacterium]